MATTVARLEAVLSADTRDFVVTAVYDPWRGQMAQEWEQRGITSVAFPQSDSRMIPACERLYDAVVHKRLVHPDDPTSTHTSTPPWQSTRAAGGASTRR